MSGGLAISVIVPFFQSAATIERCIESLRGQELGGEIGDVELLFVDNGSRDGSTDIVSAYAKEGEVALLGESQPGAYAARNAAIDVARGEILAFTDADCCPDADWLAASVEAMRSPQVGVAVGHCRYPPQASFALRLLERYENTKTRFVTTHCPPDYHFVYANNMAVRRDVFERIGRFEEWARAGDTELVHRMARELPELRVVYSERMRVTHLEFERARDRLRRLRTYTGTNQRIDSFRELSWRQRVRVLGQALRGG